MVHSNTLSYPLLLLNTYRNNFANIFFHFGGIKLTLLLFFFWGGEFQSEAASMQHHPCYSSVYIFCLYRC